jgi:regulator of extracellular matrix RemA (YlzA/DUF370 family)
MFYVPLRFISVGADNVVCASRIIAILDPLSNQGKRLLSQVKKAGNAIDARGGKKLRALILMDNDLLIMSSVSPITLFKRIERNDTFFIKNMQRIDEALMEQFVAQAAEDGIRVIEKDEYERFEKENSRTAKTETRSNITFRGTGPEDDEDEDD